MDKYGWYTILGNRVWVENGFVKYGLKEDPNGHPVKAYPYMKSKDVWLREGYVTMAALAAGIRSGTKALL